MSDDGLLAILTPNEYAEVAVGGTIGVMTGGSLSTEFLPGGIPNLVGYTATFGADPVYGLSASTVLRY